MIPDCTEVHEECLECSGSDLDDCTLCDVGFYETAGSCSGKKQCKGSTTGNRILTIIYNMEIVRNYPEYINTNTIHDRELSYYIPYCWVNVTMTTVSSFNPFTKNTDTVCGNIFWKIISSSL